MAQSYQNLTSFCTFAASLLFAILLHFIPSPTLSTQIVILDTASDLRGQWKVEGDSYYVEDGQQVRVFEKMMPPSFSFKSIKAKGVWVILPSLDPTPDSAPNTTMWTNKVNFSFATAAQLLNNVKIRFNAAGNSTAIKITSPNTFNTISPRIMYKGWIQEEISLGNTNRFTIEAATYQKGDFILIDRLIAEFVETTTPFRPKSSTTTTPLPKNDACHSCGQPATGFAVLLFLTGMIVRLQITY